MNLKSILKGTALSFIFSAVALIISAVLVYFFVISEQTASIAVFAAIVIGVFISSFGTARANNSKILLNSMSIGVLFSVILLVVASIINKGFVMHTRTLALISAVIASDFIGVMFGK